MEDNRRWIASSKILPKLDQKIYFFSSSIGILRGAYKKESEGCIFYNEYYQLDSKQVEYWMPYDHSLQYIIPLPPNYYLSTSTSYTSSILYSDLDISVKDSPNSIDNFLNTIPIPENQRELIFTYDISTNEVLTNE